MENTLSVSFRLIFSASMLTVLSACGGGGGSSSNNTPPPAANTPPVLESIGAQSVAETETLNFTVTATDADATTPDLTATGLPTGATFNPADGTFNWAPVAGDADSSPYSVTFTAADEVDQTLTATETVEITVTAVAVTADCTVAVTSPLENDLKAVGTVQEVGLQINTATLEVSGTFSCTPEIPAGWGVKLAVAGAANGGADEITVTDADFIGNLAGLAKDEYTLTATVVDENGANGLNANGDSAEVVVNSVGLGDYYVAFGDSITKGTGDDFENGALIDGAVRFELPSADGRTLGGYPALLNDALTERLGYPHLIVNAGYEGINSTEGLNGRTATATREESPPLATVLGQHPTAQRVLLMFGMNDARLNPRVGTAQFESNMEGMIANIQSAGMEPVLALVNVALGDEADVNTGQYADPANPGAGSRGLAIQEFNTVINGLVSDNVGITTSAPNFYNLFLDGQRYDTEYLDNIHPDRTGYTSMANTWADILAPTTP